MAGRRTSDEKLDELAGFAADPEDHVERIRAYLGDKNNYVVSRAVRLVSDAGWRDLTEALLEVFERFVHDPVKRDPGCHAKLAVIDALSELSYYGEEPFLTAARHRQPEPAFGPPVDTAVSLRVNAAMGLAQAGYRDLLFELAALLNDPEPAARIGVMKVLEYNGGEGCELMLRMKLHGGDPEPDVMAECISTLMRIAPERSVEVVGRMLGDADAFLAQTAALALGESRLPEAWPLLREHYGTVFDPTEKADLLLPMALTRQDEAISLLLDEVSEGATPLAVAAVDAMRIFVGDDAVTKQLEAMVRERGDARVSDAFAGAFGG
jgi:HEAT repeat protein